MGWLQFHSEYHVRVEPPKVEVYLVDVKSRKIYRAKGAKKDTTKLVDKVLAAFVEGRGEKLELASIPAEQTTAQVEEKTRAAPYRIGVFPFGAYDPYEHWQSEEVIGAAVDAVQTFVDGQPMFVRTYSFYDDVLNAPRLRKPEKLWAGGQSEKKPAVSLVSTAGRERNVDGVLMGWLRIPTTYGLNIKSVPVEIYLIDVDTRKVYRAQGTNTTKVVDKVLAAFVEGRGEKLDIASISAEQTPAQVEEKTRTVPYRIGVFPCAAYSPWGEAYSEPAQEATADALQTFVDGHPSLVLAYSYFDRMLNEPRLRKVHKLWAGGPTKKKPVVSLVSTAGRERNLDGVLMCWLVLRSQEWYQTAVTIPIEVYLIDVASHKVYWADGNKAAEAVDKVVSQFLDDHPKVVP